jgi:hypothetical protein
MNNFNNQSKKLGFPLLSLSLSLTVEHLKVLMVEHLKVLLVEHLKVMAALTVEPAYASLAVEPLPVLTHRNE